MGDILSSKSWRPCSKDVRGHFWACSIQFQNGVYVFWFSWLKKKEKDTSKVSYYRYLGLKVASLTWQWVFLLSRPALDKDCHFKSSRVSGSCNQTFSWKRANCLRQNYTGNCKQEITEVQETLRMLYRCILTQFRGQHPGVRTGIKRESFQGRLGPLLSASSLHWR